MSNKKIAVLVPESQLTDAELEEIAGGLSLAVDPDVVGTGPTGPDIVGPKLAGFPRLNIDPRQLRVGAAGCSTDDSGAMGCPG